MFCSKCGAKLDEEAKFCSECGSPIKKDDNNSCNVEKNGNNEFTQSFSEIESGQLENINADDYNNSNKKWTKSKINKKVALLGIGVILFSVLTFFIGHAFSSSKSVNNKNVAASKDLNSMKIIDANTDDFPSVSLKVKVASNSKIKDVNENSFNVLENGNKQKMKKVSASSEEENVFLVTYETSDESFDKKNRQLEVSLKNKNTEYSTNGSYQLSEPIESKISINQIDSSNFPEINVYFTAEDNKGDILKGLKKGYIKIKEGNSTAQVEEEILDLKQMDLKQPLNINLVMDTSDSMTGHKIDTAKDAAQKFLNSVQFDSGDLVELITFNNMVSIGQPFTNQKSSVEKSLLALNTSSQTSFYDALNAALVETSAKKGPKCIIAFTDGLDNNSKVTSDYVIDLAKKLGIPIYIIGIGNDVDSNILQNICVKTGGHFTQISDIEKLQQIYNDIFKQQKEQYILKYKTKNNVRDGLFRNIDFKLRSGKYLGVTSGSYLPKYAIDPNVNPSTGYSSQYGMTDTEKAMYDYQYNFVKAVNSYDFSNVAQYIDPNGPLYNMQKSLIDSYKSQGIQEKLIYYSIESTKKVNDNEYELVVYEKFYITYGSKVPALMEYRNVYTVKNTSNGLKVSGMPDLKILNNVPVNYNSY